MKIVNSQPSTSFCLVIKDIRQWMKSEGYIFQQFRILIFYDLIIVILSSTENSYILWPYHSLIWYVLSSIEILDAGIINNNN